MTLTFKVHLGVIPVHVLTKFHDPNSKTFRDLNFGKVILVKYFWSSYGQTESDAYEPTVHTHRWAQKCDFPPVHVTGKYPIKIPHVVLTVDDQEK